MNNINFEEMRYQFFILLAEVLKLCPDMRYSYLNHESFNREDLLIFYGSNYRQKSKDELIIALKDKTSDVKIKELKSFDYRAYENTKNFNYNIYSWNRADYCYELELENISFDTLIQIIIDSFIKYPINVNILDIEYQKKKYFKNLKISLVNLKTKCSMIFTEDLKSLFDVKEISLKEMSLEEIKNIVSKLKYCILKSDFEDISYGKISKEIFKQITNLYCSDKGIVKDKKCFNLLKNKFGCEPIKRLHYFGKYILVEIE